MLDHCDRSLPSNRTVASEGPLPACSGLLGVAGATRGGCGRLRSWSSQFGSGCAKHAHGRAPRAARFRTVEVRRDFLEFIARDYSQSRCIWASILTDCRGRGKDRVFVRAVRRTIQLPRAESMTVTGCWMFDVGCWMFALTER